MPTPQHQEVVHHLTTVLDGPADAAGLDVHHVVNVRLGPARIVIPDLVIARPVDPHGRVVDASAVVLVAEVVSAHSAVLDRVLKMHLYAEAGIAWYLVVEPDGDAVSLRLFGLDDGNYGLRATAAPGDPLTLVEPVTVTVESRVLAP
ncbi:Uma2 family endonuclease [Luedemannella flava]|uniref:Uma2 family endonuclease n=1 Tax=Luedemannella flava TaxID=349316 RepID=UPI0031DC6B77